MPTAFETLIADPYAPRRYLVELDVWDRSGPARTNLYRQSNDLTLSPWAASSGPGHTAALSSTVAPDAAGRFTQITYGNGDWRQSVAIVAGGVYTASIYAMRGNQPWATLELHLTGGTTVIRRLRYNFDTDSLVLSNTGSGAVDRLGGGLVRLSLTAADDGDGTLGYLLVHAQYSVLASGNTALYWGAQFESGSTATSLIATTTAQASLTGDVRTLYFSTDGFASGPADTPAHTYYEPRLRTALTFSRALYREGRIGGRSVPGSGVLSLANGDRGLDWLASAAIDGRTCRVLLGGEGFARADFGLVFDGTAAGLDFTPTTVDVRLRDWAYMLARPLLDGAYTGAGAWEGPAALAGVPKPKAFGRVRNCEPVLVDPANLRYQYHDGVKGGQRTLVAVRDRGVLLTAGSGYTNSATTGGFTLLAAPAGTITCDVDAPQLSAGAIVEEIATTAGGLVAADLDAAAVAAFKALNTSAVGYFARDQVNCDEALDSVVAAVGGYWGFDRAGYLDVGRLDAPTGTAVATYTDFELLSFERVATRLPVWSLTMRYRKNWRPMSQSDLATSFLPGGVNAAAAPALTDEWSSLAAATSSATRAVFLLAETAEAETLLDDAAAATAERDRLFAIDGTARDIYRAVVKTQPFARDLGDEIALRLNRYGLSAGKNFRVISMTEDSAASRVELELWG